MLLVLWKCRLKKQGRFAAARGLGTKTTGGVALIITKYFRKNILNMQKDVI